ncbi:MAG: sensor histidine kinase [Pedobacter sp.]|nr:MAG: sensor histidine kinase [Pedobacter sp.]
MKNLSIISVFFFFFLGCDRPIKKTISSHKADSLAYFFEKANNDSVAYEKRQLYTKKAITIISKDKNDSMNRVNYFKVANRYYNMGDFEDYKNITQTIVEKSITSKDTLSLIKAYKYMVDYYAKDSNFDSIYYYNYKVEKLYRNLEDDQNLALILVRKAILQHHESDYLGCEISAYEALKILKRIKNSELSFQSNNILGIVYGELEEYKLSNAYYNVALKIINEDKSIPPNYQFKATVLNNLGVLYREQNRNKDAIQVFNLALNEKNLYSDRPNTVALIKDNLGYSKFKLGEHDQLPNLFFEALKINDSLRIIPCVILNNIHLSEYYVFKKDTLSAVKYANEAYVLAKENNLKRDVLLSLEQLVQVDPKQASKYSKEHFRINDSILTADQKNRNKFARIEFETDELALEKDKLSEHKRVLIFIAVGILLLAVVVFIIRFQITKNKELKLLQQQQNANEEIYQLMLDQQQKIEEGKQLEKKRISRELHDGIMGRLSSIRLNLFILNKKTDPETITKCLEHIDEIQNIEKEIKTIAYDLEKNVFSDTIGFITIVKNLFKSMEEHSNLGFHLDVDETIEWETLNGNTKINLYRVLQESLHNINKYANAKNVSLRIHKIGNAISLAIEDDGIGFNVQKIKKGLGLTNMEERTKEMNGKIKISSEEGGGTKINLIIPV